MSWKKTQTLCIFYALFVCTFYAYAATNREINEKLGSVGNANLPLHTGKNVQSELHSVLLKNLKNNDTQKKILEDLKNFVPNGYNENSTTQLNKELLNYIYRNKKEGNILLNEFIKFCDYMYDATDKLSIPDDDKLKIECRIDELKTAAEKFGMNINSYSTDNSAKSCRVLEVNDDLGVVILPIGYFDGIRVGRNLLIPNAGNARATIISVREFVSAAILTEGQLKNVSPGMLVNLQISEK